MKNKERAELFHREFMQLVNKYEMKIEQLLISPMDAILDYDPKDPWEEREWEMIK